MFDVQCSRIFQHSIMNIGVGSESRLIAGWVCEYAQRLEIFNTAIVWNGADFCAIYGLWNFGTFPPAISWDSEPILLASIVLS
jgi:hypothetical protein